MPQARERQVQEAIVRALTLKGLCVLGLDVGIPITGKAAMIATAHRRRMGVRAGTPDICIALPEGRCVWLEVKAPADLQAPLRGLGLRRKPAGRTSDEQDRLHDELRELGHAVAVVQSIEQALQAVVDAMQTRAAA
jgi:hypothetical protein